MTAVDSSTRSSVAIFPSATCEDSTLANRHVGQKDPESLASPEHAPQMSTFRCIAIIAVCISAFIVNNSSQLAINVILPVIQRELEINPCDLQWLSGGFSLGYGSLLLLSGRLSDIYGHKLFLQLGLFIFAISSLASALARTSIQLSIFRATMGVGSAVSAPALLGVLGRSFEVGSQIRILAYAAFSAGAPLGSATGLLAGGFIVERTALTWRSFFYFCLAFSTLVMVFVTFIIPADDVHVKKDTVDWIGAGLIISGLALLILSLATGSDSRWAPAAILGIFFASLSVLIAFVAWEAYLERQETRWGDPLMKLSMFRRECFGVLQCIAALLWFGFVDANYFLNIFFEEYLELNLTETVVRFIPMLIVGILLNVIVGFLMKKWPAQILVVIGCAGTMISCLLMAITDPKSSYWGYSFLAIALSVVGADFVFAVGTMYGAKIASKNEQGVAGGIFQTFSQIGRAIGLSISTIVQVKVTKSQGGLYGVEVGADLNNAPRPIFLHGIRAGMWTCFASVALATLLAATCLNKMGYVGKQQGPTKTEPHKGNLNNKEEGLELA